MLRQPPGAGKKRATLHARALSDCLFGQYSPRLAVQGNSDLAPVFVDSAYSPDQQVAAGYFQVSDQAPHLQFCCWLNSVLIAPGEHLRQLLECVFSWRLRLRDLSTPASLAQVLTEVYAARPLPLPEHVVVALVLHKVVDPRGEVRDAARGLLVQLARRAWGREARYRCAVARWSGLHATAAGGEHSARVHTLCCAVRSGQRLRLAPWLGS